MTMDVIQNYHHNQENRILKRNLWKFFKILRAQANPLSWKTWSFLYKWCYYSERYTMSSNDITLTGKLPEYFMSNISLEKTISCKWADFSIKVAINNLFDEEYLSVLSRPMPGINFEIFLGITPKW